VTKQQHYCCVAIFQEYKMNYIKNYASGIFTTHNFSTQYGGTMDTTAEHITIEDSHNVSDRAVI